MTHASSGRFIDRTTPPHIATLTLLAALATLSLAVFLPSLQSMTDHFQTDYAVMQLAVSGYLAITAVLQIFIGPISDRFGRRPVALGAAAIFALASLGAVFAPTIEVFLVCRALQAAVATLLVLSRAIIRDMVGLEESAAMIGYVTMAMSLVPMLAPMLGGVMEELFGWQSTFLFMAASGALVVWMIWVNLGETVREGGMSFAAQFRTYPQLFGSPRFWGYSLTAGFSSGAFFAFLGGATFVAVDVFSLSPFWAGMGFGAPAVGYMLGNYLTARMVRRVGINRMILAGSLLLTVGMATSLLVSLAGTLTAFLFYGFCTMVGLGNGLILPNATAGTISVRPELAATASGLGAAIMIGIGALLSALAAALLSPGSGALPLQWVMFATALASILGAAFIIGRTRQVEGR